MAGEAYKLGMNAKVYYKASGASAPTDLTSMTELSNVTDVTLNHETGEADVTTRANNGWRATGATLKECTIEFEMIWKPSDAGFVAVKNAWINNTTIALAAITGNTSGDEGPVGDFSITNFSRQEPLEEAIKVSVTAKLARWGAWYTVA